MAVKEGAAMESESTESKVRYLLQRLDAESRLPAEKLAKLAKMRMEEPEPEMETPPRTSEGVRALELPGSRGIEAIAMAGLRDVVRSSKALDMLVSVVKNAESLVLRKSLIGDGGISALARAFADGRASKLQHLDLSDTGLTEQGFGALTDVLEVGVLSGLAYLDVSHNLLRDEGSGMLAGILRVGRLPALQDLSLSHCYIGDDGLRLIMDAMQSKNFSSWGLHALDLSANVFREEGMLALSNLLAFGRLPYLKHLNLSYNIFGESGSAAFAHVLKSGQLSGLTHLLLSRCYLGDGVSMIMQALETGKLPHLQVLDLSCNDFRDQESVALVRALGSGRISKLRKLVVGECGIAPERVESIVEALELGQMSQLQHLDLSKNFSAIRSSLSNNSSRRSSRRESLSVYPSKQYTIVRRDLGNLSLARLISTGFLDRLQYLNLSKCGMSDDGLVALAEAIEAGHVPNLRQFFLADNDIQSKRSIHALARALVRGHLTELQELELGHNENGDDITMALAAELNGSDSRVPVVQKLGEKFWGSESLVETLLRQLHTLIETRLGFSLRKRKAVPATSTSQGSGGLKQSDRQSSVDDEDGVPEPTGYDNKLIFTMLLVGAWVLAMGVSQFSP